MNSLKPRITLSEFRAQQEWQVAFAKVSALGKGAKVTVDGTEFELLWINEDPAWIQVGFRHAGKKMKKMVRRDDPLMIELAR